MWTQYQLFIAVGMVITGSINTLATKYVRKFFSHWFVDHSFAYAKCLLFIAVVYDIVKGSGYFASRVIIAFRPILLPSSLSL